MVGDWYNLSSFWYHELIGGLIFSLLDSFWWYVHGWTHFSLHLSYGSLPSGLSLSTLFTLPMTIFSLQRVVIFYLYKWAYFHNFSVLMYLLGQEPSSLWFSSPYLSVWLGFGSRDCSTTPWLSPYIFPTLNLMDLHRTKGVTLLNVSGAYVSNINSIHWRNTKLLVRECRVQNLGINGGEGKWPIMFPNVLIKLYSESWVSLHVPSSI